MKSDVYISVDIETDGPIPGEFSMVSLGACVVDKPSETFYREMYPSRTINKPYDEAAFKVCGLDRSVLLRRGVMPDLTMLELESWLSLQCGPNERPVFVGFNATFDWSFVNWYFHYCLGRNPFGIAGLDIKAYYMGKFQKTQWAHTSKRNIPKKFHSKLPHTHNALDDALEQAELFRNIRDAET